MATMAQLAITCCTAKDFMVPFQKFQRNSLHPLLQQLLVCVLFVLRLLLRLD
jgi:hypothetical protein